MPGSETARLANCDASVSGGLSAVPSTRSSKKKLPPKCKLTSPAFTSSPKNASAGF
jgi:hypothetical protein